MTEEETKLLDAMAERLAVVEAKVEALKTAPYRELSLEERVEGVEVDAKEAAQ